jgi:hypothetical protein
VVEKVNLQRFKNEKSILHQRIIERLYIEGEPNGAKASKML